MTKLGKRPIILCLALLLGIGCALVPFANARAQAPALPPEPASLQIDEQLLPGLAYSRARRQAHEFRAR